MSKERVLVKITGLALVSGSADIHPRAFMNNLAAQLKKLQPTHQFGIVVGGGNFFRGDEHGAFYGLAPAVAHQVGMLATALNGLILQNIFHQNGLPCALLSAQPMDALGIPEVAHQIAIEQALAADQIIIFVGGVGAPFFSTDTTAVVRALQMGASCVWKATNIDGVYNKDPRFSSRAKKYDTISYTVAIEKQLSIMDLSAFALAYKHRLKIRVFNLFGKNSLLHAARNASFGTLVS